MRLDIEICDTRIEVCNAGGMGCSLTIRSFNDAMLKLNINHYRAAKVLSDILHTVGRGKYINIYEHYTQKDRLYYHKLASSSEPSLFFYRTKDKVYVDINGGGINKMALFNDISTIDENDIIAIKKLRAYLDTIMMIMIRACDWVDPIENINRCVSANNNDLIMVEKVALSAFTTTMFTLILMLLCFRV